MSLTSKTFSFLGDCLRQRAFPSAQALVGTTGTNVFKWEHLQPSEGAARWRNGSESPLFDLASLTKFVSSSMVFLRLYDRGVLSTEDRVGRFFPGAPADKKDITLKQLLTHTGGFKAHWMLSPLSGTGEGVLNEILAGPLASPPGARVEYSCMGFILLGLILEKAGGARLDTLARDLVFDPLGMTQTCYLPLNSETTERKIAALPTEWDDNWKGGGYIGGAVHDENARTMGGVSANAGIFSNAGDLAEFARMLLKKGEGFIKRETFDKFTADHTPGYGKARGLGCQVARNECPWPAGDLLGSGSFGHTGFTGTSLYVDPSRELFFILLTNRVHLGRNLDTLPDYRALYHRYIIEDYNENNLYSPG